jgi:hypothetical protein
MEIEVHQSGGVLGLDRRYVIKDGTIEVIDKGRSRGSRELGASQAARISALAASAAAAHVKSIDEPISDDMETNLHIRQDAGSQSLRVRTGDEAPSEVWDLIGEVSRASEV